MFCASGFRSVVPAQYAAASIANERDLFRCGELRGVARQAIGPFRFNGEWSSAGRHAGAHGDRPWFDPGSRRPRREHRHAGRGDNHQGEDRH